jgi:hypothetical protein
MVYTRSLNDCFRYFSAETQDTNRGPVEWYFEQCSKLKSRKNIGWYPRPMDNPPTSGREDLNRLIKSPGYRKVNSLRESYFSSWKIDRRSRGSKSLSDAFPPNWCWSNRIYINSSHPDQISEIASFSVKHPIAQRRSHFRGKKSILQVVSLHFTHARQICLVL